MTRETRDLIARLSSNLPAVRSLAPVHRRALTWLLLAAPSVASFVFLFSPRRDLAAKLGDWRFLVEQGATLATAILAAICAFAMTVPGRDRRMALLPLVPLAIWIGVLGDGCVRDVLSGVPSGLGFRADWVCLPIIAAVGAWPAVLMLVMLRRGAPLTPHRTVAMGALAAAGLGNFGLRLFHQQDVSLTILVWQVGSTLALASLASWAGPRLLRWRTGLGCNLSGRPGATLS